VEWLVEIAKEYGLFVALVIYVLYDSKQREDRYIQREKEYIAIIATVKAIKDDVVEIKDRIFTKGDGK
jgi:hypothetical protein